MTTAAKTTFGNKLYLNPAPEAATTLVAELLMIDPPVQTRATLDATTHDSAAGAEEFITEGTYDPGEIKGQVHYVAASAGDMAMITALTTGALQNIKISAKASSGAEPLTTQGYVISYGPDGMQVKGKQTASFAIKLTGAATHGTVA